MMMKKGIPKTTAFVFLVFLVAFLLSFTSQINLSLLLSTSSNTKGTSPEVIKKIQKAKQTSLSYSGLAAPARSSNHSVAATETETESKGAISCDCSHKDYDLWSINGPTLLDPLTSTFYSISTLAPSASASTSGPPDLDLVVKFHPYPRKTDETAKSMVNELTLTSWAPRPPSSSFCGVTHTSPALVFSTGGYTGNFYHQFNDGLLALYVTLNSLMNQDVILVVTNWSDWWAQKYSDLLRAFTKHPIINMDNQTTTHCFPSAIVGLVTHGPLVVNPKLLPRRQTLLDFHGLLENIYSPLTGPGPGPGLGNIHRLPRLVLVNRKNGVGREILNLKEVVKAIKEVGFKVTVFEPKLNAPIGDTYRLLHGSHAMLAVHGAAMTHLLFLRKGMVLGEIVPIGTDWLSENFYEKPARVLGLEYMKYKIQLNESSLSNRFGAGDLVIKNPTAFVNGNWTKAKVYMKTQNVRLDIIRFRVYLKEAFNKAKRFMAKEG